MADATDYTIVIDEAHTVALSVRLARHTRFLALCDAQGISPGGTLHWAPDTDHLKTLHALLVPDHWDVVQALLAHLATTDFVTAEVVAGWPSQRLDLIFPTVLWLGLSVRAQINYTRRLFEYVGATGACFDAARLPAHFGGELAPAVRAQLARLGLDDHPGFQAFSPTPAP